MTKSPVSRASKRLGKPASSTTGYTLSPGSAGSAGTLALDNPGTVATIMIADGSYAISAPVILAAGLMMTPSASATQTISSKINQTGLLRADVQRPRHAGPERQQQRKRRNGRQ